MLAQIIFESLINFSLILIYVFILISVIYALDKVLYQKYSITLKNYINEYSTINKSIYPYSQFKIIIQK